jgi:hypothetical protein
MSKVAVIIETRKYKALPFVLNNVMSNLPEDWHLQIFHGLSNLEYIKDVIKNDDFLSNISNKITFTNLRIESITPDDSSLEIMLTENFWKQVIGEIVLYFECDSMLCPNSKFKVSDFEQFEYIGGYWGNTEYPLDDKHSVVMNGGLSIRKRQFMLDIIKNDLKPYLEKGGNPCEDYFVTACVKNMPTSRQVRNFSIDCSYIQPLDMKAPFGIHKPWGVIPSKGHGKYYDEIKDVCDNAHVLEKLQEELTWWNL